MQIKYCIQCEEDVIVEDGVEGHTVLTSPSNWNGFSYPEPEVYFCTGPFASVQPPSNFERGWNENDWELYLDEPSQEELAIMNVNAEVLHQDFD